MAQETDRVPVELYLSAEGLPKMDLLSNTDPLCVVLLKNHRHGDYREIGRTETIDDTQAPRWTRQIVLDWRFECYQEVRVTVYDQDEPSPDLALHERVGSMVFSLSEIMRAPGQRLTKPLWHDGGMDRGALTVCAAEVRNPEDEQRQFLRARFAARGLDNLDTFLGLTIGGNKSDPFLTISRAREDGTWMRVWHNERIMDDLNPRWPLAFIPLQALCNGDLGRPLKIEVWDWDSDGSHDFIGELHETVPGLVALADDPDGREIINPAKQRSKGAGRFVVLAAELAPKPSMLDFLRGGCQVSLVVGVDWTGSNQPPNFATSLHFLDPVEDNAYQAAIRSVGGALAPYDSDRRIPVFGFGGKPRAGAEVSHCFPLNGSARRPEVEGVDGILAAYDAALATCELAGPTYFAPLVREAAARAAAIAEREEEAQGYLVLLLLTDGDYDDPQETADAIVEASTLPLSIVIVGIGPHDFARMEALDADDETLQNSQGVKAQRDIVQFVNFARLERDPAELARQTLAEIPAQLTSYFESRSLGPHPPLEVLPPLPPPVSL